MYGILFICSIMMVAVSAGSQTEPLLMRLCGRYLTDTLYAVCNGVFNSWSKKSHTGDLFPVGLNDDYWQPSEESQKVLPWPWHRRPAALLMHGQRHKRQGVYNECCEKRCTLNEIRSYCSTNPVN